MIVIKVGGSKGVRYDAIAEDAAILHREGQKMVLVHGGSSVTNDLAEQLGHPPQFVTSVSGYTSRRTDRRTLEIFTMACAGHINKHFVELLQKRNVNAVGLSGLDGRIWEGERKEAIKILQEGRRLVLRDDFTGKVEKVNTSLLLQLLDCGYLPVLSPPAVSYQGEAINIDGDRAAAITATSLKAECLIILSNVPGLLERFPDESTLIPNIPAKEVEKFMSFAEDRMKKKVLGAVEAVAGGVNRIVFADGRLDRPIFHALAGKGTVISL